jgi:hypothetical protein
MPRRNERHVLLPVICEHCQQKQMVQMRARSEFHPVAIRAAVEATRLLKPLVQWVAKATRRACRP